MIEVKIEKVIPVYPEYMHIQWSIKDPNGNAGEVTIMRSGSPEGPFNIIETGLNSNQYFYQDYDLGTGGLSQATWYRLQVTSKVNPDLTILSEPVTVEYRTQPHRFRIARKARRDLYITLSRLNGSVFIVLKRRRSGARCSTCYNPFTQDSILSQCGECYGTTYTGGYYDPVTIWGKIDPQASNMQFGLQGVSENNISGFICMDYPLIEVEDIIVEKQTNRRFKVMRNMQTESSRIAVHQDLQISELARTSSEYSIPVSLS
jgi:hypothetical protein